MATKTNEGLENWDKDLPQIVDEIVGGYEAMGKDWVVKKLRNKIGITLANHASEVREEKESKSTGLDSQAEAYDLGRTDERRALIKKVRGLKKVCGGDLQMNDEYEQCHGFNQALDQVLSILESGK